MAIGTIYTYQDVLSMIDAIVPRKIIENRGAAMINLTMSTIWDMYDWEDSISKLPPFFLVPLVQDYPNSMYDVKPANFAGFRQTRLVYVPNSPPRRWELGPQKHLELTSQINLPHAISYQKSFDGFRVFPRPASNMGAPYYMIEGTYKTQPPNISVTNLDVGLQLGDDFLQVWLEGLVWAGLKFAGDERAGTKIMNQGQIQYSGKLGEFISTVELQAADAGLNDGDVHVAPAEPLVGYGSFSGLGGYGSGGIF